MIPHHNIIHAVRAEIEIFAQGAPQSDDITMLALKFNGKQYSREFFRLCNGRRARFPAWRPDESLKNAILDKNIWVGSGVDISPDNGTPEERTRILQSIGLEPYKEYETGGGEGDFHIDPDTGILAMGRWGNTRPQKPTLPDGLIC